MHLPVYTTHSPTLELLTNCLRLYRCVLVVSVNKLVNIGNNVLTNLLTNADWQVLNSVKPCPSLEIFRYALSSLPWQPLLHIKFNFMQLVQGIRQSKCIYWLYIIYVLMYCCRYVEEIQWHQECKVKAREVSKGEDDSSGRERWGRQGWQGRLWFPTFFHGIFLLCWR